jgi:site-specific recombinase XerD
MVAFVVSGPLAPFVEGFVERLGVLGYREAPAAAQVGLFAHLSCWMESEGIPAEALTTGEVAAFLAERRRLGHVRLVAVSCTRSLVAYLTEVGVFAESSRPATGPLDAVAGRYIEYLVSQRGLTPRSVAHYEVAARLFADEVGVGDGRPLASLTAAEVSRFVVNFCARPVKMSPRELVSCLRSFLRFCHLERLTPTALAGAVPSYASWRQASLPRALPPAQTARLLAGCDRRTRRGRRDYAVLVCLSRLGLRAGEIAALGLDDIDWRAGEVVVHGKGPRVERLPLPVDVGEAIAGYLQWGRPDAPGRAVFVRMIAPLVALTSPGVTWVVYDACDRAGLPRVGAHTLRHSAASDMLRAGANLTEIGQVLRHRHPGTTAIYAKVDHNTLDALARPWPGSLA